MPFFFKRLEIPEVQLIEPKIFPDGRGFFLETYKRTDFIAAGIEERFVQDNHSHSSRAVLRGLHFQRNPHSQGKLLYCLTGSIFDVAVDIRKGSPTYGRWVGAELSDKNRKLLYVPPGFAHGFQVLSEEADIIYKCTAEYSPKHDRGILWNDPDIGIKWPLQSPLLSDKDAAHPLLGEADINFEYLSGPSGKTT